MPKSLGERIKEAREAAGVSQQDLAERLHINYTTLSKYENDHRVPDADLLSRLAKELRSDPAWLLSGGGEGGVGVVSEAPPPYMVRPEYAYLPVYDVVAAAGHGAQVGEEEVRGVVAFRRDWVWRELGVDPVSLVVISVKGESMEPTIRAGDLIVIDRRETTPSSEGLYVVRIADALIVKRVQVFPDRTIVLVSDHPAYKPITLRIGDAEQVAIVGRVVWVGRRC